MTTIARMLDAARRTGPLPIGLTRFAGASIAAGIVLAVPVSSLPASAQDALQAPGIESFAAAAEPPAFDTPEAAVEAFRKALQSPGSDSIAALLGLDAAKLEADENTGPTLAQIGGGIAEQLVVEGEGDRRLLQIGAKLWPLPFPLVKVEGGKWAFDTFAGLEEIVNRRVGENELQTIATMVAYVDAQEDYASQDRDEDGVEEFAQELISSEGTTDGLYWPADDINGESPAGDLNQGELDDAAAGEGYFGYRYRILTGQGGHIAGGAYDYVINGNMIAGFGLLAWPAIYGETGVKTFAVNQHGVVYETDLGPATEAIAKHIDRFDPDESWDVVAD
jgi:hypothetical protein